VAVRLVDSAFASAAAAGVAIGYGVHLAADPCTPSGVPLWAPFSGRRHWLLPARARINTGSAREHVARALLSMLLYVAALPFLGYAAPEAAAIRRRPRRAATRDGVSARESAGPKATAPAARRVRRDAAVTPASRRPSPRRTRRAAAMSGCASARDAADPRARIARAVTVRFALALAGHVALKLERWTDKAGQAKCPPPQGDAPAGKRPPGTYSPFHLADGRGQGRAQHGDAGDHATQPEQAAARYVSADDDRRRRRRARETLGARPELTPRLAT
jgi:hypothetical protein